MHSTSSRCLCSPLTRARPILVVGRSSHHRASSSSCVRAPSAAMEYPAPIVSTPAGPHDATVIMLHGLGDSGRGWASLAGQFRGALPTVKFIFPTAPTRPIARNGGRVMTGWYGQREDAEALFESKRYVEELVQAEVDSGIPSSRVAVAGFSQGGAVALVMLRSGMKLGAVVAMSSHAQLQDQPPLVSDANQNTPVLMCHGDADTMVDYELGRQSYEHLKELGANVELLTFQGMAHTACSEELQAVSKFLKEHL